MSNRECEFMSKYCAGGSYCGEFYLVWTAASREEVEGVDGVELVFPTPADGKTEPYDVFIDPRYDATAVLKAIEALPTSPDYGALVEEGVLVE